MPHGHQLLSHEASNAQGTPAITHDSADKVMPDDVLSPRTSLLSPPSTSTSNDIDRRRTTHRHRDKGKRPAGAGTTATAAGAGAAPGRSKPDRTTTHSSRSSRHFLRLLVDEEHHSSKLRRILATALARIDTETQRAEAAESRALEASQRFGLMNDATIAAQQDAARAQDELRLCQLHLDNARMEVERAQGALRVVEAQRDEAEAAAARARTAARKLREDRLVQMAKEEGRRRGFETGFLRGQQIGFGDGRAEVRGTGRPRVADPIQEDLDTPEEAADFDNPIFSNTRPIWNPIPQTMLPHNIIPPALASDNVTQDAESLSDVAEDDEEIPERSSPPVIRSRFVEQMGDAHEWTNHLESDPLPTSDQSHLSNSRTPPIQVYSIPIPPHDELEEPPSARPPPVADAPPTPESPVLPTSTPPRSSRFSYPFTRTEHQRRASGGTTNSISRSPTRNRIRRVGFGFGSLFRANSSPAGMAHSKQKKEKEKQPDELPAAQQVSLSFKPGILQRSRTSGSARTVLGLMRTRRDRRMVEKLPEEDENVDPRTGVTQEAESTPNTVQVSPVHHSPSLRVGEYNSPRRGSSDSFTTPEIMIVHPSPSTSDSPGQSDLLTSRLTNHANRPLPPTPPSSSDFIGNSPPTPDTTALNTPVAVLNAHGVAHHVLPPDGTGWFPQGFVSDVSHDGHLNSPGGSSAGNTPLDTIAISFPRSGAISSSLPASLPLDRELKDGTMKNVLGNLSDSADILGILSPHQPILH